MSKQPWLKFYPADWRADPALKVSSLAARGLWVEMLAIMHEAEPRGCLAVKGRPVTAAMLATLVGSDENTVNLLLNELEQNGVFSRKKNGVIFSRRMELDENKARKNRENGKKGGNPTLCKQTEKQESVKPEDKAKIPDTRSQIIEDTPNVVSSIAQKRSARGTRIADDWQVTDAGIQHALSKGLSQSEIHTQAERFKDHWLSKAGSTATKLDWEATWRTWIGNYLERRPALRPAHQKPKSEFWQRQEEFGKILDERLGLRNDTGRTNDDYLDLKATDFGSGRSAQKVF